ncbi:MAG TPA: hypothetical protein VMF31_12815 [Solirubrobacterales bacterium]|nr:hypothetical protein [Solirubrobacterales bacterium]
MNLNDRRFKTSLATLLSLMLGAALTFGAVGANAEPSVQTASTQTGGWNVSSVGEDTYSVSWVSSTRIPVTSARPQILLDGEDLGPAGVAADGRTATVTVQSASAPDPGQLDILLSGRSLDEPEAAPDDGETPVTPFAVPPTTELGVDPGRPGPLEVTTSNYTLPSFKYPGMKGRLEMKGHVVRPAEGQLTGDAPLVLFLHGRHEFCYSPKKPSRSSSGWPCDKGMRPVPSDLGYDYMQRLLASQGFMSVSIAANGVNGQDGFIADGGAGARGELVRRHLDKWAEWAADGRYGVDLDKVVLVGHSRGGEGVNRAAEEIPLDAPYRIAGQILLAPTNFARQTAAYVPTVTVLPYCDGDVSDLQGQSYTDVARDLTSDDTSLRSSVTVMGANHNFFNTEWTPRISKAPSNDDWFGGRGECGRKSPTRLNPREQRAVGKTYVAGAVQLMTGFDPNTLPMFDGSPVRVASAGKADVRSQAIGGGRLMIRPGLDATLDIDSGAKTQICAGRLATAKRNCGRFAGFGSTPHWVDSYTPGAPAYRAFEMSWTGSDRIGGLALDQPLSLAGKQSVDLRMVVDPSLGNVRLKVRLVDVNGNSVEYQPPRGGLVPSFPAESRGGPSGKYLAQTVRVPVGALSSSEADLDQISSIDIIGAEKSCGKGDCSSGRSRIWILDAGVVSPSPLPAVPGKRLPLIDVGRARAVEGDGHGTSIVKVPFKVTGEVSEPSARFVVGITSMSTRRPPAPVRVNLSPGQTSGFIEVPYRKNRITDEKSRRMTLTAYPLGGAMPRKSPGFLELIDDDPRATLKVIRRKARIRAGQAAVWKVKLSRTAGFDVAVSARSYGFGIWKFGLIRAGERSTTIRIPTRRKQFKGRSKSLTVLFQAREPKFRAKSTIRVIGR